MGLNGVQLGSMGLKWGSIGLNKAQWGSNGAKNDEKLAELAARLQRLRCAASSASGDGHLQPRKTVFIFVLFLIVFFKIFNIFHCYAHGSSLFVSVFFKISNIFYCYAVMLMDFSLFFIAVFMQCVSVFHLFLIVFHHFSLFFIIFSSLFNPLSPI